MKAMILAAGEGTRLRPLTLTMPKPMVPVGNIPLLVRTLRLLAAQGIREIAINLYHRAEVIRAALGDGSEFGVRLHYSEEAMLLGTAGGVRQMAGFLDETFLILYGDNLYHFDATRLLAFHREKHAAATIATFETPNPSTCGLVLTDGSGHVTRFQEKPPPHEVFTNQANAGVYVLEPTVLDRIPAGVVSDFGKDTFPQMLQDMPTRMFALPLDGYLQDTGTLSGYQKANWDILSGAVGSRAEGTNGRLIGSGTIIDPAATLKGRNCIGAGCVIAEGVHLTDTILWDDCRIEAGANISGAVLGRGVIVGAGATVSPGVMLGEGETVPPGALISSK